MAELLESRTRRLRLRQWRNADRLPFATLNADKRVMEFFPAELTRTESDALAERCQAGIVRRGWGLWAVERLDTYQFVGYVGLETPSAELPCSPCVEVGWRLAHQHWGNGFATEAARAVLNLGFEQLGLHEIVSFTAVRNRRSRAVMERLGMTADVQTFEHPHVNPDNPLRTHCLYRLSREDWRNETECGGVG